MRFDCTCRTHSPTTNEKGENYFQVRIVSFRGVSIPLITTEDDDDLVFYLYFKIILMKPHRVLS